MPSNPNSEDVKRAQEQLHRLEELLDELKRLRVDVPDFLTKSVKGLRIAIDTGADLGDAAAQASSALARYTNKVNEECQDDTVCLARDIHFYQARNLDYTLNWNNRDSVVRNFVRATLQRYVPQRICAQLDLCRPRN